MDDGGELTGRLASALAAFARREAADGIPPTITEVGAAMGLPHPNHAKRYLDVLVDRGHLTRAGGGSRAYRLPAGAAPLRLPFLGPVAGGPPVEGAEPAGEFIDFGAKLGGPGAVVYRVRGGSMAGVHIADGDFVIVRPRAAADDGRAVVVRVGGGLTLKTLRVRRAAYYLEGGGPDGPTVRLTAELEPQVVGVLVGVFRDVGR